MATIWDALFGLVCEGTKKAVKKCKPQSLNRLNSHYHKCDRCGFIWRHHNNNKGNEATHTCPCGREVWHRFNPRGIVRAMYVGCCKPFRREKRKAA